MTDQFTNQAEVEGDLVYVMHVDDSGASPVRTVLALVTKDDVNFETDEEENSINLASERRSRRYRTHNTATLSVQSLIAVDLEAMSQLGLVDTAADGELQFDNTSRRWLPSNDEYLEVGYGPDDDDTTYANLELVHRFEDVEVVNPTIDIGANPPLLAFDFWVNGTVYLDWTDA